MLGIVIVATIVIGGLYIFRTLFSYNYDNTIDENELSINAKPNTQITNIALFGVDTRETDIGTRSDAIMILTVDNTNHKLKLASLMRDSLVSIEDYDDTKLTHAYAYGGAQLAIKTINQNFDMNIEDYITVDFDQMKVLVDYLGGVDADVSQAELDEANEFIGQYSIEKGVPEDEITYITETGYQQLNGVQALCYARIRKGNTGDDWGRTERQSEIMFSAFDKVQTKSTVELFELLQKMLPYVTTSLSPTEIASIAIGAVGDGMPPLTYTRIPLDSEWEYSSSGEYIVFDLELAATRLNEFIYEEIENAEIENAETE